MKLLLNNQEHITVGLNHGEGDHYITISNHGFLHFKEFGKPDSELLMSCRWTKDDEGWKTSCGEKHLFETGGPFENNHKYCPYCGNPIGVVNVIK